jgi:hypothetical protein
MHGWLGKLVDEHKWRRKNLPKRSVGYSKFHLWSKQCLFEKQSGQYITVEVVFMIETMFVRIIALKAWYW